MARSLVDAGMPSRSRGSRLLLSLAILLAPLAGPGCGGKGGGPRAAAPAPAPLIASFAPAFGFAGTTMVTLKGAGFAGFTAVRFGGVAVASAKGAGEGQITVQVPPGAVTGAITVVTPRGSHTHPTAFTVLPAPAPAPEVTGFQPSAGAPGTTVVLSGTHLTGVRQVAFGGASAPVFVAEDATRILAEVPADAATGPLTVWTAAGTGVSQAVFTVLPAPVPHRLPPVVTAFTPLAGAPGTRVVLTGARLASALQVDFGGVASPQFNVQDDQTLVAYVPQGAVTGVITVLTAAGTGSSAAAFTLAAAPVLGVTGLDPGQGAPGDVVTVTGAGFTAATEVTFGGVAAPLIDVQDDTTVVAVVPDGAVTGPVGVLVPGGIHLSPMAFTIHGGGAPVAGLPVITEAFPTHGVPGTQVLLGGTGLLATTAVVFGPAAAREFRVLDDTALTAVVPPGAETGPITVANPAGLGVWGPFTVDPPDPVPVITGFSPAAGTPGTPVTIQGAGFAGIKAVTFGGFAAPAAFGSGGDLLVQVPDLAVTGPIVVVTAAGHAASATDFTVVPPAPPLAMGFLQAFGRPGDIVTITGANLDQVRAVQFSTGVAGVTSTTDQVRSLDGGTLLNLAVPADADTGPVSLVINGNPVAVPGGAFTVFGAVPVITGVNPVRGIPGTEVTLTGSHLLRTGEVTFAGAALDPARITVVGDSEVRVRVPDQGEAGSSGILAVRTATGTAGATVPFTFELSRAAVLRQRVERTPYPPAGIILLDFPEVRRAAPYGLQLPLAPVFHPDLPRATPPSRADAPDPSFILNLRLPAPFYPALPEVVQRQLANLGVDPGSVEIYLEGQHNVWDPERPDATGDRDLLAFKPHYWADPDTPAANGVVTYGFVQSGLFAPFAPLDEGRLHFPHAGVDAMVSQAVRFAPDGFEGAMLARGDRMFLDGLTPDQSWAFWSIARQNERTAVTLHLLLNDRDQGIVAAAAADLGLLTLGMVVQNITAEPDFSVGTALTHLVRPVVTGVTRLGISATLDEITIHGDLLDGHPRVRLGELEDIPVTVLSGAMLRLVVATGTEGELQVVTDLGESDPVRLDRPDPRIVVVP